MPVAPQQDSNIRPYVPGEKLKPGETIVQGPSGPMVIRRDYSAPLPEQQPEPLAAPPPAPPPKPEEKKPEEPKPYIPGQKLGKDETMALGPEGTPVVISKTPLQIGTPEPPKKPWQPPTPPPGLNPEQRKLLESQQQKTDRDVEVGRVVISISDGERTMLSDLPLYLQQEFKKGYKEGGMGEAYEYLVKASGSYAKFVKNWNESVGAAQRKYEEDWNKQWKEINELILNYVKVADDIYIHKDDWAKLDKKYQDIVKEKGYDAMVAAMGKDDDEYRKAERDFEMRLAATSPYLYLVYKAGGVDVYNKAVKNINANQQDRLTRNIKALDELAVYKEADGYNLGQYIRDNPNRHSIEVLQAAGFGAATLSQAREYVNAVGQKWDDLNNKEKSFKVFIAGQALGFRARGRAEDYYKETGDPFSGFTDAERQKIFEEYLSIPTQKELRDYSLELLKQEWIEAAPIWGLATIGGVAALGLGAISTAASWVNSLAFAGLGAWGEYEVVRNWDELNTAEKAIYTAVNAIMLAPLVGSLVKVVKEPNIAAQQRAMLEEVFNKDRAAFKKYVSSEPRFPKNYTNEFDIKYTRMVDALKEYGEAQIKLSQAREIVNGIKFAETPQELKLVRVAKARIRILEKKLPELEAKAAKATEAYVESVAEVAKIDDPAVLKDMSELPRRAVEDTKAIAEEIAHPRDIKTIQKDLSDAINEMAGRSRGRYDTKAYLEETEYINRLNRELYFAKVGQLDRYYAQTIKADALARQIEQAKNPRLKAELLEKLNDIKAKNVELQKRFFESIEKTTEPAVEGEYARKFYRSFEGRESYADVIGKLDDVRNSILSRVKDADSRSKINAAFNVCEWAISAKEPLLLLAAKNRLLLTFREVKLLKPGEGYVDIATFNKTMAAGEKYVRSKGDSAFDWWKDIRKSGEETTALEEAAIRQKSRDIYNERLKKLLDPLPDYVKRQKGEELIKSLRDRYEDEYFRGRGFKNLDEYLDIEKIEVGLRKESLKAAEIESRIKARENEMEAYKRAKKTGGKDFQKLLDDIMKTAEKQQEADRRLLTQVRQKTQEPLAKPVKPGEHLPAKVEVTTKALSKEAQRRLERAKRLVEERAKTMAEPRPFALPLRRVGYQPRVAQLEELEMVQATPIREAAKTVKIKVVPAKPGPVPSVRPKVRPMVAPIPSRVKAPEKTEAPAPMPLPKAATPPAELKAPAIAPKPIPGQPPKTAPAPKTIPGTVPPRLRTPPPTPPRPPAKPPIKPMRLPKTDTEKRKLIKEAGGMAVAYVRGHPRGKGMWHVWVRPKDSTDLQRVILYGLAPEGARIEKGAQSAYRSIQHLFGKAIMKRVIQEDTGAVDTVIELGGKQPKISFEKDVRLTPRGKRLTPKAPRITQKTPRITPKTPRIS